jgi:FMN phosphatase YigB (HAD superfamily)
LFIDDNLRNIESASAMDIQTIHFKNPNDLKSNLKQMGIHF